MLGLRHGLAWVCGPGKWALKAVGSHKALICSQFVSRQVVAGEENIREKF